MLILRNPLDMSPGGVPLHIHVSQYDTDFTMIFELYSHLGEFSLETGSVARIRVLKPDRNVLSLDGSVYYPDNTVTIPAHEQMTPIAGNCFCELTVTKNNKRLGSANFVLVVEKAAVDKDSPASDSIVRELTNIMDRSDEIVAAANQVQQAKQEIEELVIETGIDADELGFYYDEDTKYLYPTFRGTVSENGIYAAFGGGGGGGGGGDDTANSKITLENTTGWLSRTVSYGSVCQIKLLWSSTLDGISTGDGSATITVNNIERATIPIPQGEVTINVGPYLQVGLNKVKVRVSDVYGKGQSVIFTITTVVISLSSTFVVSSPFTGPIRFPYTPVGSVSKTVYFYLDDRLLDTVTTTASNNQLTYTIPAQNHGAHKLRVFFTTEINGEEASSNVLNYEFISVEDGAIGVIVSTNYFETEVSQYSSIVIPYMVYDPEQAQSTVNIIVNGETVSTLTVDRSPQTFSYQATNSGPLSIRFSVKNVVKEVLVNVAEIDIDAKAETEDLVLYLTSKGRSNNENAVQRSTWRYNDISATLSNFNWTSDGWQIDSEGITVLRIAGDARVTIPYKPFATDFRGSGKTIEFEFSTRNVLNYDSVILSCMSGGRGVRLTAQKAEIISEQSTVSTQYKEDEHVRISFVVEKRTEYRLLFIYINGIASGVVQYPNDDDFSQVNPVNITIGSSTCGIDIYCIRIYDNNLNRYQILNNWIADTQSGPLMLERYARNNVYDAYGSVVIDKLPSYLPYFIQTAAELPQYKGDKKTVSGSYVDVQNPTKSFTFTGAQSDVQGTSSQYYPRKNYKVKFKNGIVNPNGVVLDAYAMNNDAVPTNTFTFKADVASSEGANNVELARLYNDACPYKTPGQLLNSKVRQGIDGFPMVMFWNDGENTSFLGKYNFNNDKGTPEVFGFMPDDESWEILNNTSNRVLWKSDDYSGDDWLNDFEARYPDTDPAYTDSAQLSEFAAWAKSTDRTQATNAQLSSPVTYDGVTYTNDTAEYRLAKFKAEAEDYIELDSALFYYLFTELFLMVDSRAKNAFPSFMGSTIE